MFRQFQHAECGKSTNKDSVDSTKSSHDGNNWQGRTNYCSDWREDTLFNLPGSRECTRTTCVVENGGKAILERWLTDKASYTAKNHKVRANAITNALKLCNANRIWDRTDIWGINPQYKDKPDDDKGKKEKLKKVALKLTGGKKGTLGTELKKSVLSCANYSYAKAKAAANPNWKPYVADIINLDNTEEWFAHYIVMKMILEPCYELKGNMSATFPECNAPPKFNVVRAPPDTGTTAAAANTILKQNASHNLGDTPERTFLNTIDNIGGTLSEVHKLLWGRPQDNHCKLPGGWTKWEYHRQRR